jgi:hypothetical protein
MAKRMYSVDGRPYWRPDQTTVGTFKLDPNKTPMQNLWDLIYAQASIWLARSGVYSYDGPEPVDDLLSSLMLSIFLDIRRKVWDGTYRKDLTLYLNVRSSAWALTGHFLKRWIREQEQIHSLLDVDQYLGDTDVPLGDLLTYEHNKLNYKRKSETQAIRREKQRANQTPTPHQRAMRQYWARLKGYRAHEDAYDHYVEDCEEFGMEAMSREEFLKANFPDVYE